VDLAPTNSAITTLQAGAATAQADIASLKSRVTALETQMAGVLGTPSQPTKVIELTGGLAFGNVAVNTTTTQTLTISNTGTTALTVSGISYPPGFSGAFAGTIAAGGSQPVNVTFAPIALTTYNGTVMVNSDKTSGTNTIAASGTGAASSTGGSPPGTAPLTDAQGRVFTMLLSGVNDGVSFYTIFVDGTETLNRFVEMQLVGGVVYAHLYTYPNQWETYAGGTNWNVYGSLP
jgi:hypothetical protein